jgi:hypothetical protein
VSLTHANGVISHLWGNALQNSQAPRFRVSGTLGCYTIEGLDGQEDALMAGKSPKTEGEHWGFRGASSLGLVRTGAGARARAIGKGLLDAVLSPVATCRAGPGPLPVEAYDALETTRILDAHA